MEDHRSLEPDESAPQTSVKHRRFQQDNELFCSGERFHSVSPVLNGEGGGQKNRERERGIETAPVRSFPPPKPLSTEEERNSLSAAAGFGGRRGGLVSSGSFISLRGHKARSPSSPVSHIMRHMERNFRRDTVRIIRIEGRTTLAYVRRFCFRGMIFSSGK